MILSPFKKFGKSLSFAVYGLSYVYKNERNFRIQVATAIVVVLLMLVFPLKGWERVALTLVITLVLVLELINTIMEKIIDILKPRIHHYVEIIKDMMAAAVLIASVGAFIIGILIFYPYLI